MLADLTKGPARYIRLDRKRHEAVPRPAQLGDVSEAGLW
jgi:hypothetical protein